MKKEGIIFKKKIFVSIMFLIALCFPIIPLIPHKRLNTSINGKVLAATTSQALSNSATYSKDQVLEWSTINFLSSYIEKPLSDYYRGIVPYDLNAPTSQILEASYSETSSCFTIKLQVEPYLGPHDPIGLDNLTFKISLPDNNKVTLEEYEHVKSFKVPDSVKKQYSKLNLQ